MADAMKPTVKKLGLFFFYCSLKRVSFDAGGKGWRSRNRRKGSENSALGNIFRSLLLLLLLLQLRPPDDRAATTSAGD